MKHEVLEHDPNDTNSVTLLVPAAGSKIELGKLNPGDYYAMPLTFICTQATHIALTILKAGVVEPVTDKDVALRKEFQVNGSATKRYRIDNTRHDGTARIILAGTADFQATFLPLESKKLRKRTSVAQGCCPECGAEGQWISMALVCSNHGPFLGGL